MDNSLAESIFQAMDIIARKNAEQINYDSTIICTITDISHIEEENYYIVSNDGVEFNAYSENKNYKKGDQVRVSILNNDQTKNRYIVGKYITEESNLIEYSFPTEKVLKVKDYPVQENFGLIANGEKKELLFYTIEDKNIFLNNFDTMYLEFKIQTKFKEKIKWGNYGIKIDIISSKNKVHSLEFDSNNFFGNSFSFQISSLQGKTFNILNFEDISKINCYLYQNDNFFTDTGKYSKDNHANIIFSNIKLGFGFNLTILPDNSIKLFTSDSKNFKHYDSNDNTNKKTIDLLWCNKNENDNFIGFNDGIGKIQQSTIFSKEQIHGLGEKYCLLDFQNWKKEASNGTISNITNVGFTLQSSEGKGEAISSKCPPFKVESGKKYEVSVDIEGNNWDVYIFFYNDNSLDGLGLDFNDQKNRFSSSDEKTSKIFTAPSGATRAQIRVDANGILLNNGKYQSNTVTFSNFIVREVWENPDNSEEIEGKYYLDFSTYDERLYQKEKQTEMELLSQKEINKLSDENTLNLSLHVDTINKNLEKALKILKTIITDFNQIITSFELTNEGDVKELYTRLNIPDQIQTILYGTKQNNSDNYIKLPLKNYYKEIFNAIYNNFQIDFPEVQNFSNPIIIDEMIEKTEIENGKEIKKEYNIFDLIRNEVKDEEKTSYDRRKNNIKNLILQFNDIIGNINFPSESRKTEVEIETGIKTTNKITFTIDDKEPIVYEKDHEYEEYAGRDFSLYSNLYSIYWYRYEEGYQDEQDLFFKENWKLVEIKDEEGNPKINIGLPGIESENNNLYSDREIYNLKKINDEDTKRFFITLEPDKKIEKIKAVIVYNHETFISDELEFLNEDDFEEEIIGKENMLSIIHGDNSKPNYFLYDDTGFLQNAVEEVKERTVVASYKGEQKNLMDAEIYWYLPASNSMLEINNSMLGSFEISSKIINLDGKNYIQYSKIIGKKEIEEKGQKIITVNENDLKFSYKIKNYYSHNFSDNTIRCKIVINDKKWYEAKLALSFGTFASNGTDYRLIVEPFSENVAVIEKEETDEEGKKTIKIIPLTLNVSLFDQNNEQVKIEPNDLKINFLGKTSYKEKDKRGNGSSVLIDIIKDSSTPPYYGILDVSYKIPISYDITYQQYNEETKKDETIIEEIKKDIVLNAYYPIPWSCNKNYSFNGPTKIIYNSQGVNPKYYDKEFSFNGKDSVTYEIQYLSKDDKNTAPFNSIGLPKLSKEKNIILPSSLYVNDLQYYVSIVCKSKSDVLWYQPILIIQNRYESNYLNSWSGEEIRIDNNENVILSTIMGAGEKNDNNQFSGVLMGSVGKVGINESKTIGLYGIHQGAQSFGFKIDGTAFIGKSGGGQIKFDGTRGIIESTGFKESTNSSLGQGMKIDLEDGFIWIYGKGIIESNNLKIDLEKGIFSAKKFTLDAKTEAQMTNYRFIHEDMFKSNYEERLRELGWLTNAKTEITPGVLKPNGVFNKKDFYNLMSQTSLGLSVNLWRIDDIKSLKDYLLYKKVIPKKIYYNFKDSVAFYVDENEKKAVIDDIIKFISNVPLNISLQDYENRNENTKIISGLSKFFDVDKDGKHSASDARLMMRYTTDLTNKYFKLDINNTSGFKVSIIDGNNKIVDSIFDINCGGVSMSQATIAAADLAAGSIEEAFIEKATIRAAKFNGPLEDAEFKNITFDRVHYGDASPPGINGLTEKEGAIYFQLVSE